MKIVKKSDIPSKIRFEFTQYTLGDRDGDWAVVDDDISIIYYIGSEADCLSYLEA